MFENCPNNTILYALSLSSVFRQYSCWQEIQLNGVCIQVGFAKNWMAIGSKSEFEIKFDFPLGTIVKFGLDADRNQIWILMHRYIRGLLDAHGM